MKLPSLSIIVPIITLGFSQLALCLPSSSDTTTSGTTIHSFKDQDTDYNKYNYLLEQFKLLFANDDADADADEIDNQYIKTKRDENTVNSIVSFYNQLNNQD